MPSSPATPEITRPSGARGRAGLIFHCSRLPDDERTEVDGIPVTGVSRTLLDLAAVVPRGRLERALNEMEVLGLTDVVSLPTLIGRYPRRRGLASLRALLGVSLAGVTRSELEERFAALIDAHDLPRPRLNADLAVAGRFYEVDCLWSERRLVVELDGRATHGTALAFERDRERDRLLLAAGWRVIRLTWRQLHDDAESVAADLRQMLDPTTTPTLEG